MKKLLLILTIVPAAFAASAQNVGIGTNTPVKKLSVNGTILLDQTNKNSGTLDSAALLFGSAGNIGIFSRKTVGYGFNGLSFWTNGKENFSISALGNIGVGGPYAGTYRLRVHEGDSYFGGSITAEGSSTILTNAAIGGDLDNNYKLRVYNGNTRFGGDFHATGNVAFGGDVDNNYRLRVIGGNSRFGGNLYATGNVAVGGDVDDNFRLRVYDGNSRFGGNVQVTGTTTTGDMEVAGSLTIDGKGSVRSNGTSPLRIGFNEKYVNLFIANNDAVSVTANIANFSGGNDDVRVFVAQVTGDEGASITWSNVGITIMGVDAATSTCLLWLHNRGGGSGILKGTIYLTTIAKN